MSKLYPYLAYENAKEALDYYERVFGAENIQRVPVSKEMAQQFNIPEEQLENTTMHASFVVQKQNLFCADAFGQDVQFTRGVALMLDYNSEDSEEVASLEAFYKGLLDSGEVTIIMPLEEQFWGGKMAQLADKYGLTWMLHSQPYSKLPS